MAKKIIKLTESDLENIVKRVLMEEEHNDIEVNEQEDLESDDSIELTLDHIAMLLKDGECSCSGQKLTLSLGGSESEDEEDEEYED